MWNNFCGDVQMRSKERPTIAYLLVFIDSLPHVSRGPGPADGAPIDNAPLLPKVVQVQLRIGFRLAVLKVDERADNDIAPLYSCEGQGSSDHLPGSLVSERDKGKSATYRYD